MRSGSTRCSSCAGGAIAVKSSPPRSRMSEPASGVSKNETLGHRGRKADLLYRIRRLLTKAEERLEDSGREKLVGFLGAGDPRGEVATTCHAKKAVRELYAHGDEATAREWI